MGSRKIISCLLILSAILYLAECRGGHGHGGSHGHSGSHSSGHSSGHSYGGGHGHSGGGGGFFSWFSSGSKSGTSHSSGSNSHTYPSSGTGLSGAHNYPASGSGSGSHHYPWSGSGSHSYPSSGKGLSGHGGGYYGGGRVNSNSNNRYYSYKPPQSQSYITPVTYAHYPQHVYVTQYQNSGSRYGDLLTGLTWYNLGRSHNNYHNHYYNDDYYQRWRSSSSSDGYKLDRQPEETAVCTLRITENGKLDVLKIPCSIVSTFIYESEEVSNPRESFVKTAVCTTNSTLTIRRSQDTLPRHEMNKRNVETNMPEIPADLPALSLVSTDQHQAFYDKSEIDKIMEGLTKSINGYRDQINHGNVESGNHDDMLFSTTTKRITYHDNHEIEEMLERIAKINDYNYNFNLDITPSTPKPVTPEPTTTTVRPTTTTEKPIIEEKNTTNGDTTIRTIRIITSTQEIVNVTVCKNMTDPLSVKGPPINASAMECAVDIKTGQVYLRHKVDCGTLLSYAKHPPPNQDSSVLPEKEKLRSWVQKSPWWTSLFIAV